jgi:hypothetical protein
MKQFFTKSALAVVLAAGLASQANAHLVTPDGNLQVGYNDTQQTMDALVGIDVNTLWKWDAGDPSLSGNGFNIVFSADKLTATLSWDLTGTGLSLYAVAWKDGVLSNTSNGNLGFLWSKVTEEQRTKSDGDVLKLTVDLAPAFKNPTAWSHIAFYGTRTGTSVPDGGLTLALIGFAMTGLGLLRRKLK